MDAFFKDYRITDLGPDEVIGWFTVPLRTPGMRLQVDKVSRRIYQDISTALIACALRGDALRIGLGGLAATPRLANHVMHSRNLRDLSLDITPLSDLRASSHYRYQVTEVLIRSFMEEHG